MALKLGTLFVDIGAKTDGLKKGEREVKGSTERISTAFNKLGGVIAAALSVQAAKSVLELADNMRLLEQRLMNVTDTTADFNKAQKVLIQLSNETGTSIKENVKLFEALSIAGKDLGASNDQILQMTESLNKLGIIGGSSAEDMKNAMRQFGQAMAGGIVRAEEWNSIVENTPFVAKAIADGLGTSVGQLRKMVIEGKVLSEDVFNSLLKQTDDINERFEKMPITIARATTQFANNFALIVAEINKGSGATQTFSQMIQGLANSILAIPNNIRKFVVVLASEFDQMFINLQARMAHTKVDLEDIFTFTDKGQAALEAERKEIEKTRDIRIAANQSVVDQIFKQEQELIAKKQQLNKTDGGTSGLVVGGKGGGGGGGGGETDAEKRKRERQEKQAAEFLVRVAQLNADELELIDLHQKNMIDKAAEFYLKGLIDEQEYQDALKEIQEKGTKDREDLLNAHRMALLTSTSQLFGGFANMAKAFGSDQSSEYRALFAASKGFAIAQAAVSMGINMSKASEKGWPANMGLIAQAVSDGSQIANIIASARMGGGREFGGSVSPSLTHPINEGGVPEILEQAGKQFLLPTGKNGTISPMNSAGGMGGNISVSIISSGEPQTITGTSVTKNDVMVMIDNASKQTVQEINTSLSSGRGDTARSLKQGFAVENNLRG